MVSLHNPALYDTNPAFIFFSIDGLPVPFSVQSIRGTAQQLIVAFDDINDRTVAQRFTGKELLLHMDEVPQDHHILHSAVRLFHANGSEIGEVVSIDESTQNRLLTIKRSDDSRLLIPYVEEWIVDQDDALGTITLNFPIELLDL